MLSLLVVAIVLFMELLSSETNALIDDYDSYIPLDS